MTRSDDARSWIAPTVVGAILGFVAALVRPRPWKAPPLPEPDDPTG